MDKARNWFNSFKKCLLAAILVMIVLAFIACTIASLELYPKYHHLTVMNCCDHPIAGLLIIRDKEANIGCPFHVKERTIEQIHRSKGLGGNLFSEKGVEKDYILIYMPDHGELNDIKEIKISGSDLKKNNWVLTAGNCTE